MARGRKGRNVSKKGNFFNLMTEEVPEDVAINSRQPSVQETKTFTEEDKPVRGNVRKEKKEKKSIFKGLFEGRTRTEMEDEIGSYGDVRDEVEKYVPLEERKLIHQTLKGITSPNQIIDTAEREGLEIQNLIYLNIITKNDYNKYLSYVDAVEAEIERENRIKREQEERDRQRLAEEREKARLRKEKQEREEKAKRDAEEADRLELLRLKGMLGNKEEEQQRHERLTNIKPEPEPEPEEQENSFDFSHLKMEEEVQETEPRLPIKEVIEGDEIVRYKGTVDEERIKIKTDDLDEEEVSNALDMYLGGNKPKVNTQTQQQRNSIPERETNSEEESEGNLPNIDFESIERKLKERTQTEEEYNLDISQKFDNVKTEEDSIKENEEEEHVDKMDIYIVGDLYKILKNSGVGGKTPTGYKIEPEDEEKHFNEDLKNYNIVLIETEEGLNDYLFSKNNLLIVTQDVGKLVKNRLAGFLRGTGDEEGNYHRVVTIIGSDTEVSHNSIEDAIMLTSEALDRYYETHPIENYYNTKKGFNSLDSFLDD